MAFTAPNFGELIITKEMLAGISCTEPHPNRTRKVDNRGQISFTPFGKECLSLHRFSLNSQLLNDIKWKSSVLNFIQLSLRALKTRGKPHLCAGVKHTCHCIVKVKQRLSRHTPRRGRGETASLILTLGT